MIPRPRRLPVPPSSVYQLSPLLSYTSPTPTPTLAMALPTPVLSTAVLSNALPQPTSFIPQNENKMTHAQKQPQGRIRRPRSAFILFRCDFVRQKSVPPSVERNPCNLSPIAASLWRGMTALQQQPWKMLAEQEKMEHAVLYPDYKFQPRRRSRGARQMDRMGGAEEHHSRSAQRKQITINVPPLIPHSPMDYRLPHRRSSSCPPPGSTEAAPVFREEDEDVPVGLVFETRDDLQRRPSRVMMYRSLSSLYPQVDVPYVPMQVAEPEELSYAWPTDPRQVSLVTPSLLGDSDVIPDMHLQATSWNLAGVDVNVPWVDIESAEPRVSTEERMMQWRQEIKREQREKLFVGFRKDQQQFDATFFTNPFASRGVSGSSLSLPSHEVLILPQDL
ncbi:uncharacterized protein ARMOST_16018 [Armillaria ostoyae]|uniref:HMG box domain-containing protein n=1 Tax=Armillaria ostoyae TaxID=47428 RepID=A0A284RV23_ARMOS|nr:uncharacterized protein ARMOST_16018 [Armillaria ostoyae]